MLYIAGWWMLRCVVAELLQRLYVCSFKSLCSIFSPTLNPQISQNCFSETESTMHDVHQPVVTIQTCLFFSKKPENTITAVQYSISSGLFHVTEYTVIFSNTVCSVGPDSVTYIIGRRPTYLQIVWEIHLQELQCCFTLSKLTVQTQPSAAAVYQCWFFSISNLLLLTMCS